MQWGRGKRIGSAIRLIALVTVLAAGGFWPTGTEAVRGAGVGRSVPEIAGGPWINSEPLSVVGLRGRVVLVEFWTYG
jgi:hypothetical protein